MYILVQIGASSFVTNIFESPQVTNDLIVHPAIEQRAYMRSKPLKPQNQLTYILGCMPLNGVNKSNI